MQMNEWYFLLTPLAVLAVLAIFRFVGCNQIFDLDETFLEGYVSDVSGETGLVSYWRLQEDHNAEPESPTADNTPVSGGTARDEKGVNAGTYKVIRLPAPSPFIDSPTADGTLTLQAAGLLDQGFDSTTNRSVNVDGGYVEIPFAPALQLTSFSIEALVSPEWSEAESGLFRTVIAFHQGQTVGAFGFALYAGPEDPVVRTGPAVWQIWLGDGASFHQVPFNHGSKPLVQFNRTNYLAITYNDSTKLLNLYNFSAEGEMDNGPFNPVSELPVVYQANTDPTTNFLIGIDRTPPNSTVPLAWPFKGRIQEVAVYDRALSLQRIISHIGSGLNL
jgi:hypothetical protein